MHGERVDRTGAGCGALDGRRGALGIAGIRVWEGYGNGDGYGYGYGYGYGIFLEEGWRGGVGGRKEEEEEG